MLSKKRPSKLAVVIFLGSVSVAARADFALLPISELSEESAFELQRVESLLPQKLKQRIGKPIKIFVTASGERRSADVVNQVARAYDSKWPILGSAEETVRQGCESPMSKECADLSSRRYFISDQPSFAKLAHFERGVFGDVYQQKRQLFIDGKMQPRQSRVYDERETASAHQSFAAAMERWVLDREYGCLSSTDPRNHRPAMAWFLWQHFGAQDQAPGCLRHQQVPLDLVDDDTDQPVWLASRDIEEVHLGWVSPGKGILSRWGHLILILITESGEKIAINYHAHMNGHEYAPGQTANKIMDGLMGEHVARLMPSRMSTQIEDYVVDQKRTLKSISLQLSEGEKAELLFQIFEGFAFYRGNWRHLSNNCVTHLIDLFKVALPHERALKNLATGILTPAGAIRFFRTELKDRVLSETPVNWTKSDSLFNSYR